MNMNQYLKTDFISLTLEEVLKSPVGVILGVSSEIKTVLENLRIHTVFDLATSVVFNNAFDITNLNNNNGISPHFGILSSETIDSSEATDDLTGLFARDILILAGIGETTAEQIKRVLDLNTIRDLAYWPPFQAARSILQSELNDDKIFVDPEIPNELVPKFNEYPVDSVSYTIYVMEPSKSRDDELEDLDAPLDLATLVPNFNQLKPKLGAIIRFEQTWTSQGLALGDLLHSLPLAPGESTKIAIIDWSRRQGVKTSEDISSLEALSNSMMQARSINEVTRAVAREAQNGFSKMNSNASVSNSAYSGYGVENADEALAAAASGALEGGLAGGIGGVIGGAGVGLVIGTMKAPGVGSAIGAGAGALIGGGGGALVGATAGGVAAGLNVASFGGGSESGSSSEIETVTTTHTDGERDLLASMTQNITDRTQQHASSSRNRKASIVQEVNQEESEKLSTRAVTNYNHMHALTIQYFEVVQLFSAKTKVKDIDRCIYVPFKPILSWTATLVERYKNQLIGSSLNRDFLYTLIYTSNSVQVSQMTLGNIPSIELISMSESQVYKQPLINAREITGQWIADGPFMPWSLDGEATLLELTSPKWAHSQAQVDKINEYFEVVLTNGEIIDEIEAIKGTKLRDIDSISYVIDFSLDKGDAFPRFQEEPQGEDITIKLDIDGKDVTLRIPSRTNPDNLKTRNAVIQVPLLEINYVYSNDWQIKHLNENSSYYTSKIFRNLSPTEYSSILASFAYQGYPLIDIVDPRPLAVSGNYLIFKLFLPKAVKDSEDNEDWLASLGSRYAEASSLVPVATGGVFAEAVQGRANSAEKLDLTRFWNWQDSPIPITAPDIAALQAGSRATDANVRPGSLDQSLVGISSPSALPDPQGLTSIISALATSNIFRDMSGLAETALLAQAALEEATKGSVATGEQASTNLAKGLDLTKDIVNKIIKMNSDYATLLTKTGFNALSGGVGSGFGISNNGQGGIAGHSRTGGNTAYDNISNAGATLNHGRRLDNSRPPSGQPISVGTSSGAGGQTPSPGNPRANDSLGGHESDAFYRMTGSSPATFASAHQAAGRRDNLLMAVRETPDALEKLTAEFPALDFTIGEPSPRNCCALFPGGVMGFLQTEYLDLAQVTGHRFGESGFFPSDSVGHVYTLRGGFVDLGHVRDLADYARYLTVRALELQRDGGYVPLASEGGIRRLHVFPQQNDGPDLELASSIGMRAAYDCAVWHEIVTWFTNVRHSSFSPEDNFSNLLGAMLGASACLSRKRDYNTSIDELLVSQLENLGPLSGAQARNAVDQVAGLWYERENDLTGPLMGDADSNQILLRRHMDAQPTVVPWLVTDLHDQMFIIADSVAGTLEKTIQFAPVSPKPTSASLIVPQVTSRGQRITETYALEIEVDTSVIASSILPAGRRSLTNADLDECVQKVRSEILSIFPDGDKPISDIV